MPYQSSNVFNRMQDSTPSRRPFYSRKYGLWMFMVFYLQFRYIWKGLVNSEPSKPPVGKILNIGCAKYHHILSQWPWWPCNFSQRLIFFQNPPQRMQSVSSLFVEFFVLANPSELNVVNETDNWTISQRMTKTEPQPLRVETPEAIR